MLALEVGSIFKKAVDINMAWGRLALVWVSKAVVTQQSRPKGRVYCCTTRHRRATPASRTPACVPGSSSARNLSSQHGTASQPPTMRYTTCTAVRLSANCQAEETARVRPRNHQDGSKGRDFRRHERQQAPEARRSRRARWRGEPCVGSHEVCMYVNSDSMGGKGRD